MPQIQVGEIHVPSGHPTEARYSFAFTPIEPCVVTELVAEWGPTVSDADIKAFLHLSDRKLALPPTPNYQLYYGPTATKSVRPLLNMFDLTNPRLRFTLPHFDPIPVPIPLPVPGTTFDIVLEGSPVTVESDFGLGFSITFRPFNS